MKENFYPLTYLRSSDDLRCGATTLGRHKKKINNLWDLIADLKEDLEWDLKKLGAKVKGKVHPTAVLLNKKNMLIEAGVEIEPYAMLDARQGPIYIAKGTVVKAQACLSGPLSIGPECRIGGEVAHSIFHGYSNKAHYGFIGHAYIGEWVNLGAGTTNSNLKNTYGTIKINGVDTGRQFLGCFIGDFAKLGIGTLIPTGAVVGLGANVFGGGMIPKTVSNFAWGTDGKVEIEKLIKTIRLTMQRRNKTFSPEDEKLLRRAYRSVRRLPLG